MRDSAPFPAGQRRRGWLAHGQACPPTICARDHHQDDEGERGAPLVLPSLYTQAPARQFTEQALGSGKPFTSVTVWIDRLSSASVSRPHGRRGAGSDDC